jgi:hypothetical protein
MQHDVHNRCQVKSGQTHARPQHHGLPDELILVAKEVAQNYYSLVEFER